MKFYPCPVFSGNTLDRGGPISGEPTLRLLDPEPINFRIDVFHAAQQFLGHLEPLCRF